MLDFNILVDRVSCEPVIQDRSIVKNTAKKRPYIPKFGDQVINQHNLNRSVFTRFSEEELIQIALDRKSGMTLKEVSKKYRISNCSVGKICYKMRDKINEL